MNKCEKFDLIVRTYDVESDEYNEQNAIKAYITFFGFGKQKVLTKGSRIIVDKYEAWIEGFDEYDSKILAKYLFLKNIKDKTDVKEYDLRDINEKLYKECVKDDQRISHKKGSK